MEKYKIVIDGKNLFKYAYIVYVIEICHNNIDKYYYIGQTGGKSHKTARPPFLRLAGHLNNQEKSNENQIYQGIAKKILKLNWNEKDNLKNKTNDFLVNSVITMNIFPIFDYDHNIDTELHKQNVKKIREIETLIISEFIKVFGMDKILNKQNNKGNDEKINPSNEILKYVDEIKNKMGI